MDFFADILTIIACQTVLRRQAIDESSELLELTRTRALLFCPKFAVLILPSTFQSNLNGSSPSLCPVNTYVIILTNIDTIIGLGGLQNHPPVLYRRAHP